MSTLDIITISIGGIAVIIYTIKEILKLKKWNKIYKSYIDKGYTKEQAKIQTDKDINSKKGKQGKNSDILDKE